MISWIGACILLVGFVVLFKLLGLIANSKRIMSVASQSLSILRDSELDDLHKEKAMQANSLALFKLFFIVLTTGIAALALPVGLIWLLDLAGAMVLDDVLKTAISWQFLVFATVLTTAAAWILGRSS